MDQLIIGLGNPGIKYHHTRHNIGFDVVEEFTSLKNLRWTEKFKGLYTVYNHDGSKIYFLKPQTFMNLSGESVVPLMNFFKITIENILVIHDEIDLPFGTVAFKNGGGLAGHNGLKSIAGLLGSQEFKRLRMGVGRPVHGDVSNWVLSGYMGEDNDFFTTYLKASALAVEYYLKFEFDKTANFYNSNSTKRKKVWD
jgi:PTH1 family peptidyl-tRNA hydrolase